MSGNETQRFIVGDWQVSPHEDTISRDGEIRRLEPLTMELLTYLASRPGEVVSRADLEEHVWHGGIIGYDAVTNTVTKLRKALGDKARDPRYISTVPKRGYQLIATVTRLAVEATPPQQEPGHIPSPDKTLDQAPDQTPDKSRNPLIMIAAAASVAVVVLIALLLPSEEPKTQITPPAGKPTLIVLPFDNLSEESTQNLFANGMTEDLITDLSGISGIRVIASNTAFSYQEKDRTPQEIHKELGADYIVTGSVRRHGDALRINARIVEAESNHQLWAKRFDRTLSQTFSTQAELTTQIADALAIQLSPNEQNRLAQKATENIAAYDHFLEGQRLSRVTTRESNIQAQAAYRQAITADPSYGRAYGALAYTLSFSYLNSWAEHPMQTISRALELAQKGVALNPDIPQTHWSLGYVHLVRKEFDKAMLAVQSALEISPNYADGYGLLALIHNNRDSANEAIANIRKGMSLNPYYTWDYPYNLGRAHYIQGEYEKAVTLLEEAKTRNPNALPVRRVLAASYMRLGRTDDAEWEVEEIQSISPRETLTHLKNTRISNGTESAQRLLSDLREAGLPE